MEFEGQNNDFGGTKRYNNIPLVPPNSFGPPPMGAVGLDFKDRVHQGHIHLPQLLLVRFLTDDPIPRPLIFPCAHKRHLASSLSADIPPRHDIYFIT